MEKLEKINTINEEEKKMSKVKIDDRWYIVRCNRAGVFFGHIANRDGREVELTDCRRLWYWDGAASLSELAVNGTKRPGNCKFTVTVQELTVLDAIEIIPCTDTAAKSILGVSEWKA